MAKQMPADTTKSKNHSLQPSNASAKTSPSLLAGLKANEIAAWDRMVHLYSPMIYYWCQKSGLPKQEIPDVFQEVFHTVARNIEKFRQHQTGTFRGWLRTITRNKVIDHFRKTGQEPHPVGGTEAQYFIDQIPSSTPTADFVESVNGDALETDDDFIRRDFLRTAMENIRPHFSEQTWQAFWRVVVQGRATRDVADELSMQPGTVRVAKSRVLKRLRQEFGDSFD